MRTSRQHIWPAFVLVSEVYIGHVLCFVVGRWPCQSASLKFQPQ